MEHHLAPGEIDVAEDIRLKLVSTPILAMLVASCSFTTTPFLFNNTGYDIILKEIYNSSDLNQKGNQGIVILNGEGRNLGSSENGGGWVAKFEISECFLQYSIPSPAAFPDYPWDETSDATARERSTLRLQMEPDFHVHLIPASMRSIVEVKDYASLQHTPFPLEPVANSCTSQNNSE